MKLVTRPFQVFAMEATPEAWSQMEISFDAPQCRQWFTRDRNPLVRLEMLLCLDAETYGEILN